MTYSQLNEILPKDLTNIIMAYSYGMMLPRYEVIEQLNRLRNYLLDISAICYCSNITPTEAIDDDFDYHTMTREGEEEEGKEDIYYETFFIINQKIYISKMPEEKKDRLNTCNRCKCWIQPRDTFKKNGKEYKTCKACRDKRKIYKLIN